MDLANGLHGDRLRGLQLCAHRGNQRLDEAIESPINLRPQFEVVRIIGKILQTEVDSLLKRPDFRSACTSAQVIAKLTLLFQQPRSCCTSAGAS